MSGNKDNNAFEYYSLNKVELIRGGKPYFDCLLQMIERSKESFHLQTYIYEDDETGKMIAEALKAAACRNVQVYIMADGYASKKMSKSFIRDLHTAGIHFRYFNPLLKSQYFYFGRRLHHKMAVADARFALAGGINITDRYNDMPGKPAWLDFAVYIEGEVAQQLCVLCWKTWQNYPSHMAATPCEQKRNEFDIPGMQASEVSISRNDWVRKKNEISSTYVRMFRSSQSHITILCSYFLPGKMIRQQIIYAAQRGVKIKIVTAGISDVMLSKYAERFLYTWLLKHNIELYEYQPNILHGKIAVCDSQWMTIGSYNINNISTYASIELNINIRDPDIASETEKILQTIIDKDCIRISPEYFGKTRNIFRQFIRWFSYQFIRAAFYVFTFYFKHRS
jgi:cardiolipin synthase